jgi:DNA-binding transcriptional MerR regulator
VQIDLVSDSRELYTIGRLARRTGLSVHTIRFWSDSGLVPPTDRSVGGYRLYDATAVARFDLVRTLRELGIDLETIQEILARRVTVAEVAEIHVRALDAEIRTLKLRRAGRRREHSMRNLPARPASGSPRSSPALTQCFCLVSLSLFHHGCG